MNKHASTIIFTVLILTVDASSSLVREKEDPWPDLPVSLNGEIPEPTGFYWVEGLENKIWHRCVTATPQLRDSWDANNFFDAPKVVELCEAIFDGNVERMEVLIEEGVDVNAKGECNMNPLYWAFHLNTDPRPFGCLMKHGADPNVNVDMTGRKEIQVVMPGYSVANLAARGFYNRHFKTVFENGGDPNITNTFVAEQFQWPAFFELSAGAPDFRERLMLMLDAGADLNKPTAFGVTFLMAHCTIHDKRCPLALIALQKGVNHLATYRVQENILVDPEFVGCYVRAIHILALIQTDIESEGNEDEHPNFYKLVAKLEELGESMEEAKKDLARWKKWKEEGRMDLIEEEHEQFVKENSKK